jgi:predicted NBD/HSP70 family sugar kinase
MLCASLGALRTVLLIHVESGGVMGGEPVLLGIDFTADCLRLLMTDLDCAQVHRDEWPLPPLADEDAWSWEVGGRIATAFACEGNRRSALAIAVAAPGTVDPLVGRLVHSTGQPEWDGLSVVDCLRRHIGAPVAVESRTVAALLGETWQGAAAGVDDALYVSLRGVPSAAILLGGRPARGARFDAGSLPAMPELDSDAPAADADLETVAGLLADAAALVDPQVVVLDGAPQHLDRLVPLLQRVLDEVAAGPHVERSELGEQAALVGAVRLATTLAYEGERKP